MPSSSGAPSKGVLGLSAAACYREFRVNRTIYLVAILVLLAPVAQWLLQLEAVLSLPGAFLVAGHTSVHAAMRSTLLPFGQGSNYFEGFTGLDVIVAGALGIGLFAYDRLTGGLFYSLEGPLRRREAFLVKVLFGTAGILLPTVIAAAGTVIAAGVSANADLTGLILLRFAFQAAGQLNLFATALAMGAAMSTALSCIATATWAGLPSLLQGLVSVLFWVERRHAITVGGHRMLAFVLRPIAPWVPGLWQALPNLSPFLPNGFFGYTQLAVAGLFAWLVAWAALMLWQGPSWWERAPFERLRDAVFFPFLWNVYYAFLSLVTALVLTALITRGTVQGAGWGLIYALLFIAGWFFWRYAIRRQGRRTAWRHALSARS